MGNMGGGGMGGGGMGGGGMGGGGMGGGGMSGGGGGMSGGGGGMSGGGGGGMSGGGGGGPSIAGLQIGNKLGAGEVQTLFGQGLSAGQILQRAENKDINLSPSAKTVLYGPPSAPVPPPTSSSTTTDFDYSYSENQIPFSEYDLFSETYNAQIQNQGLEAVERIRQAGATERLKYEVDNRIPEIQAEAKGKLDLQAIVNAGYKNIANIERGSDMVRNITSMFNF